MLRPVANEAVLLWLGSQDRHVIFTTAVTQAEILFGIEALPRSKRRTLLAEAADRMSYEDFQGRVLPFDSAAATFYGETVALRESIGRPLSQFDAVIASICRSLNLAVATRNVADFEHCGITVINPWVAC